MKLYALECEGGFVGKGSMGYECVPIEKATVVNNSHLTELELMADSAKEAGLSNLWLVELTVAEGECVKKF